MLREIINTNKNIMISRHLILIWLLLVMHTGYPQSLKRSNIWYFGRNAGLDFNTSPPTPISNNTLNTWEGCATICDEEGRLLMYTDGSTIWNKNHQRIPNATNLGGNSSSSQSGIIVPKPSSNSSYYVISVDYEGASGGVQYCEIDMNANAGLGGIVRKNIRLLPRAVEKLTTVPHCNGRHYWIIAHETGNNKFNAWLLTENGIDATNPVISSVGQTHGYASRSAIGYMKSSPEGNRIALAINDQNAYELFDFDKKTGKLSNPIYLRDNRFYRAYGIEFSPNGKFLYLSQAQTQAFIYQIELGANNATDLMSTLTVVGRSINNDFGALQIASDGRIYIAQDGSLFLSTLNNPNQKGLACNFQENSIRLSKNSSLGLPNLIPSLFSKTISVNIKQAQNACGYYTLEAQANTTEPVSYKWYQNGKIISGQTTSTFLSKQSGEFVVEVTQNKECDTLRATASATVAITHLPLSKPTIISSSPSNNCQQTNVTLEVMSQNSLQYDWYRNNVKFATQLTRISVTQEGFYQVKAYNSCDSTFSDSLKIVINSIPTNPLGQDTSLCEGQHLLLKPLQSGWTIVWDDGSNAAERSITQAGVYSAQFEINGCNIKDTLIVTSKPSFQFNIGNDFELCFGEKTTLFTPSNAPTNVSFQWFNASQKDSIRVEQAGIVWLESDLNGCKYRDSLIVRLTNCSNLSTFVPDVFSPNQDGFNDIFYPIISQPDLVKNYYFTVFSRWGNVLYHTSNPKEGWNGEYLNSPCSSGYYVYTVQFQYLDGTTSKTHQQRGSFLLLR